MSVCEVYVGSTVEENPSLPLYVTPVAKIYRFVAMVY
jgi:hypothetical protein